jgi:hypothetical protein
VVLGKAAGLEPGTHCQPVTLLRRTVLDSHDHLLVGVRVTSAQRPEAVAIVGEFITSADGSAAFRAGRARQPVVGARVIVEIG